MKRPFVQHLWLKLLALLLATALYYALKEPSSHLIPNHEGHHYFQQP